MVYNWALQRGFDAPYGVMQGSHTSRNGRRYLSVTFGRARTLDATVEIYNRNYMLLRKNSRGYTVYRSVAELQQALDML